MTGGFTHEEGGIGADYGGADFLLIAGEFFRVWDGTNNLLYLPFTGNAYLGASAGNVIIQTVTSGNIVLTPVDKKVYPSTNGDVDLGDATHYFKDIYYSGRLFGSGAANLNQIILTDGAAMTSGSAIDITFDAHTSGTIINVAATTTTIGNAILKLASLNSAVTLNNAGARLEGFEIDLSPTTLTSYTFIYGLLIQMPAVYGAGTNAAIYATGNGATAGLIYNADGLYLQLPATMQGVYVDASTTISTNTDGIYYGSLRSATNMARLHYWTINNSLSNGAGTNWIIGSYYTPTQNTSGAGTHDLANIYMLAPVITAEVGTNNKYGIYIETGYTYGIYNLSPTFLAALTVDSLDIEPSTNIDALDITDSALMTSASAIHILFDAHVSGTIISVLTSTAVLTASTNLMTLQNTCAHDGIGADNLYGAEIVWSGAIPQGTANSNLFGISSTITSVIGSGGAQGGFFVGLNHIFTGTLNGTAITYYGANIDISAGTFTSYSAIYGLNIAMPAVYGAGIEAAIYATGGGNIFSALSGDGVYLRMTEAGSNAININNAMANNVANSNVGINITHNVTQGAAAAIADSGIQFNLLSTLSTTINGGTINRQTAPYIFIKTALSAVAGGIATFDSGFLAFETSAAVAGGTETMKGDMITLNLAGNVPAASTLNGYYLTSFITTAAAVDSIVNAINLNFAGATIGAGSLVRGLNMTLKANMNAAIRLTGAAAIFKSADYAMTIQTLRETAGAGDDLTISAASGNGGANNGADLILSAGLKAGGGLDGVILFQVNGAGAAELWNGGTQIMTATLGITNITSITGAAYLSFTGNGNYIRVPQMTTANLPGVPGAGMLAYDSTIGGYVGYNAGIWEQVGGAVTVGPFTAGEALATYDTVYINADGEVYKADATSMTTMTAIGIVVKGYLLHAVDVYVLVVGIVTDAGWAWTAKDAIYVSTTTAGGLQNTVPAGLGNISQCVGTAIAATKILFNFNNNWIAVG